MQRIFNLLRTVSIFILIAGAVESFVHSWYLMLVIAPLAIWINVVADKVVQKRKRYMHYTIAIFSVCCLTGIGLLAGVPGLMSVLDGHDIWKHWED